MFRLVAGSAEIITRIVDAAMIKAGQDFDVKGMLTAGNTGLGNKLLYHDYYENGSWWWSWNFTTNADGSWIDTFHYNAPGTYYLSYYFFGDDQYAATSSESMTITVIE